MDGWAPLAPVGRVERDSSGLGSAEELRVNMEVPQGVADEASTNNHGTRNHRGPARRFNLIESARRWREDRTGTGGSPSLEPPIRNDMLAAAIAQIERGVGFPRSREPVDRARSKLNIRAECSPRARRSPTTDPRHACWSSPYPFHRLASRYLPTFLPSGDKRIELSGLKDKGVQIWRGMTPSDRWAARFMARGSDSD